MPEKKCEHSGKCLSEVEFGRCAACTRWPNGNREDYYKAGTPLEGLIEYKNDMERKGMVKEMLDYDEERNRAVTMPFKQVLQMLKDSWNTDYGKMRITGKGKMKTLTLITGGWSENEEILAGLSVTTFHQLCFQSMVRGGKIVYKYEEGGPFWEEMK